MDMMLLNKYIIVASSLMSLNALPKDKLESEKENFSKYIVAEFKSCLMQLDKCKLFFENDLEKFAKAFDWDIEKEKEPKDNDLEEILKSKDIDYKCEAVKLLKLSMDQIVQINKKLKKVTDLEKMYTGYAIIALTGESVSDKEKKQIIKEAEKKLKELKKKDMPKDSLDLTVAGRTFDTFKNNIFAKFSVLDDLELYKFLKGKEISEIDINKVPTLAENRATYEQVSVHNALSILKSEYLNLEKCAIEYSNWGAKKREKSCDKSSLDKLVNVLKNYNIKELSKAIDKSKIELKYLAELKSYYDNESVKKLSEIKNTLETLKKDENIETEKLKNEYKNAKKKATAVNKKFKWFKDTHIGHFAGRKKITDFDVNTYINNVTNTYNTVENELKNVNKLIESRGKNHKKEDEDKLKQKKADEEKKQKEEQERLKKEADDKREKEDENKQADNNGSNQQSPVNNNKSCCCCKCSNKSTKKR